MGKKNRIIEQWMKEELQFKNVKTWNFRWNLGLVSSTQGRIASRRWLAVKNANQVKCFSSSFNITFEVFIDLVKSAVPIRHSLIYLCKLVNLLSIQRNGFWNRDVHFFHHKKDACTHLSYKIKKMIKIIMVQGWKKL